MESVIFCCTVNILENLGPTGNEQPALLFFQITGGTGPLIILGSRMLIHQKEATGSHCESSFRISSNNSSIPQFRQYDGTVGSVV